MVPPAEFTLLLRPADPQGAGVEVRHRRVPVHRRAGRRLVAARPPAGSSPGGPRCAGPAGSPRWRRSAPAPYFLINDLGRPARFHHMLRVAKPTSPMSVGTWILAAFGPAAGLAAVAEAAPWLPERGCPGSARRALPPVGHAAGLAAAATAPALATYTGVLLADTAVPSWHEAYPELPFIFAGSALASGAGVGLLAAPPRAGRPGPADGGGRRGPGAVRRAPGGDPARAAQRALPRRAGRVGCCAPARALTAAGVAGALLGRRSRVRLGAVRGGAAGRVGGDPVRHLPRRGRLGEGPEVHGGAAAGAARAGGRRRCLTAVRSLAVVLINKVSYE